jgi:hypothetical protein
MHASMSLRACINVIPFLLISYAHRMEEMKNRLPQKSQRKSISHLDDSKKTHTRTKKKILSRIRDMNSQVIIFISDRNPHGLCS